MLHEGFPPGAPTRSGCRPVADALPVARIEVLDGQRHIAIDLVPDVFAGHVLRLLPDEA